MGKICAPVGVEDPHIIPNAQITTSSYYLSYYPHMGRLSGVKDWCQKLLQSLMTTYKLIWERFTLSVQSQCKGRKMGHSPKATGFPSPLMKAAAVYIRIKTLITFEIIPALIFSSLFDIFILLNVCANHPYKMNLWQSHASFWFINCAKKSSLMLLKMIVKYLTSYGTGRNTYQSSHGNNTQCYISQLVCALWSVN